MTTSIVCSPVEVWTTSICRLFLNVFGKSFYFLPPQLLASFFGFRGLLLSNASISAMRGGVSWVRTWDTERGRGFGSVSLTEHVVSDVMRFVCLSVLPWENRGSPAAVPCWRLRGEPSWRPHCADTTLTRDRDRKDGLDVWVLYNNRDSDWNRIRTLLIILRVCCKHEDTRETWCETLSQTCSSRFKPHFNWFLFLDLKIQSSLQINTNKPRTPEWWWW